MDGYHDAAPVKDLPCEFMSRDNKAMHAKPDLRVVLKWVTTRSGSVIADVMWLMCPVDMEGCNARHRVLLLRFASERKEDAANSAGTAFAPRQLGSLHKLVGLAI